MSELSAQFPAKANEASPLRLVVTGANGRMGRLIIKLLGTNPEMGRTFTLTGALEHKNSPALGQDAGVVAGIPALGVFITENPEEAFTSCDVVVDFSTPEASLSILELVATRKLVLVLGTTGFDTDAEDKIKAAARATAIIRSGNMSFGIAVLAGLVKQVAKLLDHEFDIEIVEMHHRMKVDAPSGTALLLGEAAAEGRGIAFEDALLPPRSGKTGTRTRTIGTGSHDQNADSKIGFASLRGGTVVGDHTVIFAGNGERLELTHRAEDRSIFATGALRAAQWGVGKAPGLYAMRDVLGLANS